MQSRLQTALRTLSFLTAQVCIAGAVAHAALPLTDSMWQSARQSLHTLQQQKLRRLSPLRQRRGRTG